MNKNVLGIGVITIETAMATIRSGPSNRFFMRKFIRVRRLGDRERLWLPPVQTPWEGRGSEGINQICDMGSDDGLL